MEKTHRLQISPDPEALSRSAAELFVRQAGLAVKIRGRFSVALSGGVTPQRTYELLAAAPFRDQIPWLAVHVFWTDERCVPPDDPRSNEGMIRRLLLDRVPIPAGQIYPIRCNKSPQSAARLYEELLRDFFAEQTPNLDLILLGLGEDGHTASLFPHTPVLKERKRWITEVYIAEQNLFRVTLTAPFINRSAMAVFLVSGASKAGTLHEVLEGPFAPDRLPAQLIQPASGNLLWMVEREAASILEGALDRGPL
jgi:6-phosphogluconolactonase